ncbi:reverse transcriptase domain-containing protein [Trichonephila clavipes]|nr:reverse transcriptase domain-containing protein [Trichonephila clavipes]
MEQMRDAYQALNPLIAAAQNYQTFELSKCQCLLLKFSAEIRPVLRKKAVLEGCKKKGLIGSSYAYLKCGKSMELRERTGFILNPDFFTSHKHIEYLVLKSRKHLNILKSIAGKNWGADKITLRLIYLTLIRSILEYGFPIYCSASNSVLKKLEEVQLSAAHILTGLKPVPFKHRSFTTSSIPQTDCIGQILQQTLYLRTAKPSIYDRGTQPFFRAAY